MKVLEQADVSKTIVLYEQQLVLARNQELGKESLVCSNSWTDGLSNAPGGAKLRGSKTVPKLQ